MMIETFMRACYTGGPERPDRNPRTTMSEATKDLRADALVASYERAGYARVEPAILQPAEPFLDLSGEDIRRRMFLVNDPVGGEELCLRPDLTIPVARDYLAAPAAGRPAKFCYLGAVFRHREDGPELSQANATFDRINRSYLIHFFSLADVLFILKCDWQSLRHRIAEEESVSGEQVR